MNALCFKKPLLSVISMSGLDFYLDADYDKLYIILYNNRGCQMKAITYTAARQNLAKMMENVCKDHAPVIVTRKTTDSVVIMSLEDYEALEETAYLLRSPKNTRRLIESIAQLEEGEGSERELLY
jgi:antitoxin YefM